jgi:glycosyltransferase involved in cell wall biosynthesis
MAKKMNTLLEDKQLYLKVNNQSIQRIKDLFTQDAVATAYEAVYLKILRDKQ